MRHLTHRTTRTLVAATAGLALVLTACGSDGDTDATTDTQMQDEGSMDDDSMEEDSMDDGSMDDDAMDDDAMSDDG